MDGELNIEEELICALYEIKWLKKKNLIQKENLKKYENEYYVFGQKFPLMSTLS